jgi:quercetin dioxygenase-like cupin family protein
MQDSCPRVLYVRSGSLTARSAAVVATLAANSAWHGKDSCEVVPGKDGAEIYRWELRETATAGTALSSELKLDPRGAYLIRCDRVDFPPGGIAYTHTHRGPGIRCLLSGEIRIKVSGREQLVRPGEAWFEAGPDPVLALASEREPTAFARVMILPAELRGKSSIRYVLPEDTDKPKRQTYQLFVDDPIG